MSGGLLTCYYDLHVSPPTYDIVSFLMRCERDRLSRGCDEVRVVLLPGSAGGFRKDKLWPFTVEERQAMRDQVAMPLCELLPSWVDVEVAPTRRDRVDPSIGYCSPMYGLGEFVSHYRDGIRPLRAAGEIDNHPYLVTITLREAEHWPHRNSQINEWLKAAASIERMGFRVVFVRDTRQAEMKFGDFAIDPQAARNIADRARLYASAALNLGVSNGPLWMALAMDVPVLMLRPADNYYGRAFGDAHFENSGITPGQQIPGAPEWQRLVWQDDTADNIVAAVEQFMVHTKQPAMA